MWCVLEFLQWKATWWLSQCNLRSSDKVIGEGLCAYAHIQADIQLSLATHFRSIWQKPLQEVDDFPIQHGPTPHDIPLLVPVETQTATDKGTLVVWTMRMMRKSWRIFLITTMMLGMMAIYTSDCLLFWTFAHCVLAYTIHMGFYKVMVKQATNIIQR